MGTVLWSVWDHRTVPVAQRFVNLFCTNFVPIVHRNSLFSHHFISCYPFSQLIVERGNVFKQFSFIEDPSPLRIHPFDIKHIVNHLASG